LYLVRSAAEPATYSGLPPFRPLDAAALERLDDDALVEYMRRARAAGHQSAGLALAILTHGYSANVYRRVALKVPAHHVEDLARDIIVEAITSAFDGTSVGQFRSWLRTITDRAIADFFRRGAGRASTEPLPAVDPEAPSTEGLVELRDAIDRVMAEMREDHRSVIDVMVFKDGTAADAAREVAGMTEANAHQITHRFREALKRELGGEFDGGGDTG
jgi:RNA polymerase sigma factor (sigma-70 family)